MAQPGSILITVLRKTLRISFKNVFDDYIINSYEVNSQVCVVGLNGIIDNVMQTKFT